MIELTNRTHDHYVYSEDPTVIVLFFYDNEYAQLRTGLEKLEEDTEAAFYQIDMSKEVDLAYEYGIEEGPQCVVLLYPDVTRYCVTVPEVESELANLNVM